MAQKSHLLRHVADRHWDIESARRWIYDHGLDGGLPIEVVIAAFVVVALIALLMIRRRLPGKRVAANRWRQYARKLTANGYVRRISKFGRDRYEHREIAEEILQRRLQRWEVVHHINGRRSDNRPENLCVMDHRDHDRYHEWYDWIFKTYGTYPRRETQLRKLRGEFKGKLLGEFVNKRSGIG